MPHRPRQRWSRQVRRLIAEFANESTIDFVHGPTPIADPPQAFVEGHARQHLIGQLKHDQGLPVQDCSDIGISRGREFDGHG